MIFGLQTRVAAVSTSSDHATQVKQNQRREGLADASLELGLDLYQQESNPAEIRKSLALAGKSLLAVLVTTRQPYDETIFAKLEASITSDGFTN